MWSAVSHVPDVNYHLEMGCKIRTVVWYDSSVTCCTFSALLKKELEDPASMCMVLRKCQTGSAEWM